MRALRRLVRGLVLPVTARVVTVLLLTAWVACASAIAGDASPAAPDRRSGNAFLPEELRALQADPTRNPLELWIERGRQSWHSVDASASQTRSCQSCHGAADAVTASSTAPAVRSAAAHFPRLSADGSRLLNLEDQIRACRVRSGLPDRPAESDEVLALSAWLHHLARGEPIAVSAPPDAALRTQWQAHLERGTRAWTQRIGRYNLACVHCHDQNVGRSFRADVTSPAHPTGFPVYRLSWARPGSIDRRLRACFSGVQAEMPAPGEPLLRELELYLKVRATGLPLDGPSLRR
ncbi:MAG: sulfur oxidation c-type cytochrome SoxA [Burkholderiaceae bacterium]